MSNSEKSKQLYLECNNTDPNVSTLMPFHFEGFQGLRGEIYYSMISGMMINSYAIKDFEDDWIPFNPETFSLGNTDKEGWKDIKSTVYRMEKKGFVETTMKESKNYIRLTCDDIFNADIYKRD